ncbi:MAG: ABC transporter ATP-binding protein [Candidatus Poribacteria bacterium]|nr:ABC transporter ATP-binding protein [Candidatus Poribacteria bacterium]
MFKQFLRNRTTVFAYIPWAFKLIWSSWPLYTCLVGVLLFLTACFKPAIIYLSKFLVDGVVEGVQAVKAGNEPDLYYLLGLIALLFAFMVINETADVLIQPIRTLLGDRLTYHLNELVLEKAASLDLSFYETPEFYDTLQNAHNQTSRMMNVVNFLCFLLESGITLVAMLVLLAQLHWLIVVILIAISTPHLLFRSHYARRNWSLITGRAPEVRMLNYLDHILISREVAKEIRLFDLKGILLKRYHEIWDRFFNEKKTLFLLQNRMTVILGILSTIGAAGLYVYVVFQATFARITLGDLTLYFQAIIQIRFSLYLLFVQVGQFYENSLFLGNLYDFLNMSSGKTGARPQKSDQNQPGKSSSSLSVPKFLRQGIEFRNVSFKYPLTDKFVLQNVSFKILPGQTVALVGENGSGKTTLIKLLTRLYDPTEGEILLDGHPLEAYDLKELREQFGVIFQDFTRYQLTAQENIGFGDVKFLDDSSRISVAAQKSGAAPVIDKLPRGYQTFLGNQFEDAVDLSGGEWQKVALSRAFLRESEILILDEPTAALDAKSEYEIYGNFAKLTQQKTTVLISHRFSTVRMADYIIVLSNGCIVEEGSHAQLIEFDGMYAELFNLQAKPYLSSEENLPSEEIGGKNAKT